MQLSRKGAAFEASGTFMRDEVDEAHSLAAQPSNELVAVSPYTYSMLPACRMLGEAAHVSKRPPTRL